MMGALVRRLKARAPAPTVSVLAPAHLADLMARMPGVDAVIDSPFAHGALRLADRWRLARSLAGRFDQAIVLPHSFKSALIPAFAGVATRTGFVGEARQVLLNDARLLDEPRLPRIVDRFCLLAEPRGVDVPAETPPPRLEAPAAAVVAARAAFGLGEPPAVALCVGAEYGPAKRWPARHFAALAQRLAGEGLAVWLIGSTADAPIGAEIEVLAPGAAANLVGRTSLGQAIDLIAGAVGVVANDSGLMHVAAA